MPLSLAMDDSKIDNIGGGGGGDGLAVAAAAVEAVVVVVDNRDGVQWSRWWEPLVAVAVFNGVHWRWQWTSAKV